MPRKLIFVPTTTAGATLIALEDIPEDVKTEIDEAYEAIRKSDGRIRAEFDTKEELELYFRQAVSYGAQRPNGKLKVRKSPTRGLKDNQMEFRVTADLPANGEEKEKKGETK